MIDITDVCNIRQNLIEWAMIYFIKLYMYKYKKLIVAMNLYRILKEHDECTSEAVAARGYFFWGGTFFFR